MKRIISFVTLIIFVSILSVQAILLPVANVNIASAESGKIVIVFNESSKKEKELNIVAYIRENGGISDMTLYLDYDQNVLELKNAEKIGFALPGMSFTPSGNYSITPFAINLGKGVSDKTDVDTTVGEFLMLSFEVKDYDVENLKSIYDRNVADGKTNTTTVFDQDDLPVVNTYVTFSTSSVSSYYDGMASKLGKVISDRCKISLKGGKIDDIEQMDEIEEGLGTFAIFAISVGGASVLTFGSVLTTKLIKKRKKSNKWKKI